MKYEIQMCCCEFVLGCDVPEQIEEPRFCGMRSCIGKALGVRFVQGCLGCPICALESFFFSGSGK